MRLYVVHYHFRPGGVRRVIELGLPALTRVLMPEGGEIVLVAGERPERGWRRELERRMERHSVRWLCEPSLGYWAESGEPGSGEVRAAWERVFAREADGDAVVWAHNQSLGRNLPATEALVGACLRKGFRLVLHHHDWWCDQRWHRWSEIRRAGFPTIAAVARVLFPASESVSHAVINREDYQVLRQRPGVTAEWLPNPASAAGEPVTRTERASARRWLRERHGVEGPVWLMPCRLLRRKNIAEALLLTRWLRPEATLVTTGGESSVAEAGYAARLRDMAHVAGWPLRLAVLAEASRTSPRVEALAAASEALLLTSLQEGFGLPYLEASAAGRPLLARRLPNVFPDLLEFGFRFPQSYEDVLIPDHLFDAGRERRRQEEAWRRWRRQLPVSLRATADEPLWWKSAERSEAWPFSRLSLTAQFEVLSWRPENSREEARRLNPWLDLWRGRVCAGTLGVTPWPARATRRLGAEAYGRAFCRLLEDRPVDAGRAVLVQKRLLRARLWSANQYPLLWSTEA